MKKNKKVAMESYRRLRNIIEGYSNDIKCISITSNCDIEGKTIIAKNIATTLATNGRKVLFIDCSLIDDSKNKNHRPRGANGLIEILEVANSSCINDVNLKNYINDTKNECLSILTLGTNDLDKYNSLFKIDYLKIVIEHLKKSFDYIIIDAPSFENLSYTQIITASTDGCFFVIKEGINEVSEGSIIKDNIDTVGCKVLGCILNKEKKSTKIFEDKFNSLFDMEYKYTSRKSRGQANNKASVSA